MLLYSPTISARLQYIATTIFSGIECTNNAQQLIESNEPKINYSVKPISANELWIKPHGLLEETSIQDQTIEVFDWQNLKVFFKTEGTIPFDFLAASFYLITRYEEYLPHKKDMYGRYAHTNSLAFEYNFLHLPLINLWLQKIEEYFSPHATQHSQFTYLPTYDIDIAYSYLHHSIIKNVGGFFKDFINGKIDAISERLQVLSQSKKDPFDIYDWLHQLHIQHSLKPIYFFLLAQKRKGYDKNIHPFTSGMTQLIIQHSEKYAMGIHPSWQSNSNGILVQQEIGCLQKIIQKPIYSSRQHYIKMNLPHTYESLLQAGIENDYSMGYGSINGFRASYTLPFKWYNLEQEKTTALTIHPFCYMDANAIFEEKLSPNSAFESLVNYYNIVKQVNGQLITIHHNHFLSNEPQWQSWRSLYETFLQSIK